MSDDTIDKPSHAYARVAQRWELLHDLMGGTPAMLRAGRRWLPQEPAEKDSAYDIRLGRSILTELYKNTITKLSSKPFSRPVAVNNMPEDLEYLRVDMDANGRSLSTLGKEAYEDLLVYGYTHLLVDWVGPPQPEGRKLTIREEREAGARATIVRVSPPELFAWRTQRDLNGNQALEHIRIAETRYESKGAWLDQAVEYIKVYYTDRWEVWRKTIDEEKRESWVLEDSRPHSANRVMLVTIYANRKGFMIGEPPMEGLAYLNLAHWRSDSDQRNILRVARFAILFAKGLSEDEAEEGLTVGPTNWFTSESEDAELTYVEHTGKAIGAGREDIRDLEERAAKLGDQPLAKGSAHMTATGANIDENRNLSAAQMWVRALESGLREAFRLVSEVWYKKPLPEDFTLDVFSDFKESLYGDEDLKLFLQAVESGKFRLVRFFQELQRRGKLPADFDAEEEAKLLETEMRKMQSLEDDELFGGAAA